MSKLFDILESFTKNPSILVIGSPRSGKSILVLQMIKEALEKGEGVICILTNTFPEEFIEGIDIPKEKANLLKFIDCYTLYTGIQAEESSNIYRVNGPLALSDMSMKLTKSIADLKKKTDKIKIIANSLSTLLTYNSLDRITRFLQVTVGKVKASKGVSFFIVEEGMHDPKYITTIASLTDITLKLEKKDGKNSMKVLGIGGKEKELKYKITDTKIIIGG